MALWVFRGALIQRILEVFGKENLKRAVSRERRLTARRELAIRISLRAIRYPYKMFVHRR